MKTEGRIQPILNLLDHLEHEIASKTETEILLKTEVTTLLSDIDKLDLFVSEISVKCLDFNQFDGIKDGDGFATDLQTFIKENRP